MENRNTWFLAFILLALGAVALLGNSFPVILVLLGLLFLVRQFDNDSSSSNVSRESYDYGYEYEQQLEEEEEDYEYEIFHQQPASAEQRVYRHALESVTRAGLDPDRSAGAGGRHRLADHQRAGRAANLPHLVSAR